MIRKLKPLFAILFFALATHQSAQAVIVPPTLPPPTPPASSTTTLINGQSLVVAGFPGSVRYFRVSASNWQKINLSVTGTAEAGNGQIKWDLLANSPAAVFTTSSTFTSSSCQAIFASGGDFYFALRGTGFYQGVLRVKISDTGNGG